MNLNYDSIMVRYGELSIKGKNRKSFARKLGSNVSKALNKFNNLKIQVLHDGIFIKLNGNNYEDIKNNLLNVFGYANFYATLVCKKNIDEIIETSLKIAKNSNANTFKICAKRSDKSFETRSDDLKRIIATHILKNTDLKVDVHNPDIKIYCTIRNDGAYICDQKQIGLGGFPVGINGKALVMMSGGIDSPIGAYLTMKKGIEIECIHFTSMPYTSKQALEKVKQLVKILSKFQPKIKLHIVNFTKLQLEIYKNIDESYAVTIMRRMMYRIADKVCDKQNISVITNGESLGQVASQTIESMDVITKASDKLILRPCVTMDKIEIIDLARKIKTFDTSILPYEDCCTIFDPKNPTTKPKLKQCLHFEERFDYNTLIEECIETLETITISNDDKDEIIDIL